MKCPFWIQPQIHFILSEMQDCVLLVQTSASCTDTLLHPLLSQCIGIIDIIGISDQKVVLGLGSYALNICLPLQMSTRVGSVRVNKQRAWADMKGRDHKINIIRLRRGYLQDLQGKASKCLQGTIMEKCPNPFFSKSTCWGVSLKCLYASAHSVGNKCHEL